MKLSSDQEYALNIINSPEYNAIFLTGKAGTGKSTVLKQIKGRKLFTAMTGMAASLIGGRTLHSLLSMGPNSKRANVARFLDRMKRVEFLIIDEVSMMNSDLLEEVFRCLQYIKYTGKLILVGDFKQLPPVQGNPCYMSKAWPMIHTVTLTQCHRQDDNEFITILNDLRDSQITPRLNKFLKERLAPEAPFNYTSIVPMRQTAAYINRKHYSTLNTEQHIFDMTVGNFAYKMFDDDSEYCEFIEKQTNFVNELTLRVGCRVMTVVNHPDGLYFNGSTGTISEIKGTQVSVYLDSGYTITLEPMPFDYKNGADRTVFEYTQIPLMLAWATTIHKSQGQSIDKLYVDTRANFAEGMTYVALSRGTNPDTLLVSSTL